MKMKNVSKIPFLNKTDEDGVEYFVANPKALKHLSKRRLLRRTNGNTKDLCTFLDDKLLLSSKQSTVFSTDLTSRDDVIIAVFSLLLILVLESILAAILLRSRFGNVSNFGFAIKQYIDLARDFRFHHLFRGKKTAKSSSPRRKVNVKLLILASLLLVFTFGLESVLLFVSSPYFRRVTNRVATISLVPTMYPDWNAVQREASSLLDRPCRDIAFDGTGIKMGVTRLVPCLTSSAPGFSFENFEKTDAEMQVIITTDIHDYGAEHYLSIGSESAKYTARGYMTHGGKSIVKNRAGSFERAQEVAFIHRQLVAFLYNIYRNQTGDTRMNIERLSNTNFTVTKETGPNVYVMMLNGNDSERALWTISMRYNTTFKAKIPKGRAALRFAGIVFRASHGLEVTGPDFWVLSATKGSPIANEELMWEEEARTVNWLTLALMLAGVIVALVILRLLLKPVGTIEILSSFVHNEDKEWMMMSEVEDYQEEFRTSATISSTSLATSSISSANSYKRENSQSSVTARR